MTASINRVAKASQLSVRTVTIHRNSVHAASRAVVIAYGEMLRAAVVPDGERVGVPPDPAAELWPREMSKQVFE